MLITSMDSSPWVSNDHGLLSMGVELEQLNELSRVDSVFR